MIINSLENLYLYKNAYRNLHEAIDYIKSMNPESLSEGKNDISDSLYVVKIKSEKNPDFKGIVEVHREWIDIHIPLTTNDTIAYSAIQHCDQLEKEYHEENDYALYMQPETSLVDIPMHYFCIIDPSIAHMAMLGHGSIEKLVFKVKI
jgi:YhcH/YjgK/YiaL family protein